MRETQLLWSVCDFAALLARYLNRYPFFGKARVVDGRILNRSTAHHHFWRQIAHLTGRPHAMTWAERMPRVHGTETM